MKTVNASKTKKRILSVTIKRMVDDSPDTSWLGEYSRRPTSEFSIDRAHALDCSVNDKPTDAIERLERIISHLNTWRIEEGNKPESTEWEPLDDSIDALIALQDELTECTCDERGNMGRGEYRYFNPSFNYVDESGHALPENTPEEVREYIRQDYERMESLNRGNWCFIGIRAEAEIGIPQNFAKNAKTDSGVYIVQHITSGGVWGIESDSDRAYLESVEKEELSDLRDQLKALGFSSRAISAAFKNVERKDF